MDTTIKLLMENRLEESRKKLAINSLVDQLSARFSGECNRSRNPLVITPNYDESCVEVHYEDLDDIFRVYPQKTKISNENSNKVVKVSSIDGAYIEGTTVYDSDGNEIGEAMVRMSAIRNKSDYSENMDDAEYRINSKLSDIRKLEKYVSREDMK